jgi:hypothetical protein
MKYTTCMQSCEVYGPDGKMTVVTGEAPPVPSKWTGVLTRTEEGCTVITVYEHETRVKKPDGTELVYHRKPTMEWAVKGLETTGQCVRFHADGSVEHTLDGETYTWGPDVPYEDEDYYYACDCRYCLGDYSTGGEEEDYYEPYDVPGSTWSRVGRRGLR